MKKALLLMSAALLTTAAGYSAVPSGSADGLFSKAPIGKTQVSAPERGTRAEEMTINFGYAGECVNLYALNSSAANDTVYLAFKFAKEDQTPYIGAKITGVNVTAGMQQSDRNKNCFTKAFAYVTESIDEKPSQYVGGASMNTVSPYGTKVVDLENPYTITGEKDIYVGYYFKLNKVGYYLPTDDTPVDLESNLVYSVKGKHSTLVMVNYADQIGSLCAQAVIKGESLPVNTAQPKDLAINGWFPTDATIEYSVNIKNMGANNISEFVMQSLIGENMVDERTLTMNLAPGETKLVKVKDIANPGEGTYSMTAKVVKVNGEDLETPLTASADFYVSDSGYERRVVIEEGTGTWCGWCPRGIVMMEYFEQNYPSWIRIAVHSGDRMATTTYASMISKFYSGFPSAVANREIECPVAGDDAGSYLPLENYFASMPALVKVDLTAVSDEQNVVVTTTTEAAMTSELPLQLAFVLVEDGVGPYNQTNYYANNANGPMAGWEKEGDPVSTIYNDVARYLDGYPGIEGSLPATLEVGEQYTFERTIPVKTVKGDNFRVVALIVNTQTGVIVNANEVSVAKSGVQGITDDRNVNFTIENGVITSNGPVEIYTLDGRRVNYSGLGAGVYIVVADGKAHKVLVK